MEERRLEGGDVFGEGIWRIHTAFASWMWGLRECVRCVIEEHTRVHSSVGNREIF